jgi:molecular chaperone GrpE (heat shock protein)
MSETSTEAVETPEAEAPAQEETETRTDWKSEARKWEQRAKDNLAKVKEYEPKAKQFDTLQAAQRTAEQRAQAEAEAAQQRALDAMQKAARTTVKAALTGVVDDPDSILDDLNIARFVTDDGEIDEDAVTALREKYAALGGGKPRTPAPNPAQGAGGKSTPDPRAEFAALWAQHAK